MTRKCPQCKSELKKALFDISHGVNVESLHCDKCGFNITDDNELNKALNTLKSKMTKEVKITRVGTGLGIRFPNEFVKNLNLKKGKEIHLHPESKNKLLIEIAE